jgi:[acyl-carrier-protein] S-malonyltransferase
MGPIAPEFANRLGGTPIGHARPPLVANVSARPITTPEEIRNELAGGLESPVRWSASIQWLHEQGVTEFLEIGPGTVLTGLVKRILRGTEDVRAASLAEPAPS